MHRPADACTILATSAAPSGLRIDCGVSTWISKRSRPASAAALDSRAQVDHRLDLLDARDLGQRGDEAIQPRASVGERADERDERAYRSAPGRRLEALDPDARERRRGGLGQARRQRGAGRCHIAVLGGVRAGAVAILEVDPQVLDRFGGELAAHARHDLVVAHQFGEQAVVRVERGERLGAPVRDERSVIAVGGDVDGVHRLAGGSIAGELRRERGVGVHQPRVELLAELQGQVVDVDACHGALTFPLNGGSIPHHRSVRRPIEHEIALLAYRVMSEFGRFPFERPGAAVIASARVSTRR